MSKPITLLVRVCDPEPRWHRWSAHYTVAEAETTFRRHIEGRGMTAWTWIGPSSTAGKMMEDPDYMPPESCAKETP